MKLVNQQRNLTFAEKIYLPEILRGMMVTIKNFFSKPVTVQYPEEKPRIFERFRGLHELLLDENGEEKCVGCSLCARVCPSDAIYVEADENEAGKKYARIYRINLGRCIFCGFCEEACPEEAIVLREKFELADVSRDTLVLTKYRLLNWSEGKRKSEREGAGSISAAGIDKKEGR